MLALYFKLIEKRKIWHEKITTVAGIGCSSRFPYFVQAHGAHYIHGRALPFASGVSLTRPDLHVFVFGGDGDAFSIGGNHLNHTARKNIKMTYVHHGQLRLRPDQKADLAHVAARFQKQDRHLGRGGSADQSDEAIRSAPGPPSWRAPRTPIRITCLQMMEAAMDHDGFSVIECLSECVEFYEGAFDAAQPAQRWQVRLVPAEHDVTDELAAYKLAGEAVPRQVRHLLQGQQANEECERSRDRRDASGKGEGNGAARNPAKDFRANEVAVPSPTRHLVKPWRKPGLFAFQAPHKRSPGLPLSNLKEDKAFLNFGQSNCIIERSKTSSSRIVSQLKTKIPGWRHDNGKPGHSRFWSWVCSFRDIRT